MNNIQTKNLTNRGRGRPKGSRNKHTLFLKDAILRAAEAEGSDGKGMDGLVGYFRMLASEHPTAFATLLGKVLPLQVHASGGVDEEDDQLPTKIEFVIVDPKEAG